MASTYSNKRYPASIHPGISTQFDKSIPAADFYVTYLRFLQSFSSLHYEIQSLDNSISVQNPSLSVILCHYRIRNCMAERLT